MAGPVLDKIARMLASDAVDRQIAAAIVLGELKARDRGAVKGLLALVDGGVAVLQRHALNALAAIGAPEALPRAMALLSARDESVRAAAGDVVAVHGERAIPLVRDRLASAPPAERRALEELLGRLGGRDAVSILLSGLAPDDLEAARAAVLPLRARVREAEPRERRRYLDQVTRFLTGKAAATSPAAQVAALKLLGFLEDAAAVPTLLDHALGAKRPEPVRQEAIVALRMTAKTKAGLDPKVAAKLLAIAETAPLSIARAALYSLVGSALPQPLVRRVAALAAHREPDRALLAIELLGAQPGEESAGGLAKVLVTTDERARAEAAAGALAKRPEGPRALGRALLQADSRDRAAMLAALLRPHLQTLDGKLVAALADAAVAHLEKSDPRYEPLAQVARAAAPEGTTDRVRALAERLRRAKGKKPDAALRVYRVLCRGADATPEDGYALGVLELTAGLKEEAFVVFGQLLDRGFDLPAALRKDRALEPQQRYAIGFHLIERGHPAGEEILASVAEAAGRTKVGQMARAKLRSAGFAP